MTTDQEKVIQVQAALACAKQARFETTYTEMLNEATAFCTAREGVLASRQAQAAVYAAARRIAELEAKLEALEKRFGNDIANHEERLMDLEPANE